MFGVRKKQSLVVLIAAALAVASVVLVGPGRADATSTASITADYAQTSAHTTKYMFGVSSWPRMSTDYATMLADAGITMIRQSSIGMEHIVPQTTVADYLNNVNDVQNPSTWNWNPSGNFETIQENDVDAFNAAGIDVFSIIAYTPSWLGVTTAYGAMPSNWAVYEDIVKKIYQHYKDKIDYFEIFNEPEIEISLGGSGYANNWSAYNALYEHALDAINSVSGPRTPVGGPAAAFTTNYGWLSGTLGDPTYGDDVDFASWHNYGNASTYDTGVYSWKNAAAVAGKPDLPTFVSEYNQGAGNSNSTDAIPWVGGRLSALMDAGVTGAFIYGTDDRATGWNASVRHDWHIINQDGTLTPRMWPIRLLSKKLGLGLGDNEMKLTEQDGLTWASAAVNADGKPVVWAVNETASPITTDVELDHTGIDGPVALTHYVADASHDATTAYANESKVAIDGKVTTTVTIPAMSVYGIALDRAVGQPTESVWSGLTTGSVWWNGLDWELGTRFQPTVDGDVTAIKVYGASAESGNHTARIWDNSTGTLAGGPYTLSYGGTAGWKYYTLPAPVALTAGTEYTVTVTTGSDANRALPYTTTGAVSSGDNGGRLTYPANAGVASNAMGARPTFSSGNNYLRDVVFEPTGNTNIALGKTATASSTAGTGFGAGKAVDGTYFADDPTNAWASNSTHVGAWWKVDLGSVTPIAQARVQFRGYQNPSGVLKFQQVPASITLQVSDDNVNWTTVTSRSTNVPTSGTAYSPRLYSYPLNTSGRYLRLLFEDGSQGGDWAVLDELTEVEVYAH